YAFLFRHPVTASFESARIVAAAKENVEPERGIGKRKRKKRAFKEKLFTLKKVIFGAASDAMAMKECVGAAEAGVRKTAGPGGEGEEVSRRCSADRPCRHNQWIKIRKLSKNVTSLRCQVCATTWFTELQKHTKCRDFYAGRCLAADTCASPHIVTRGTTGKSSLKAELDVVKGHKKQDTKPSRAACGKSEAEPEAESCGAGSGRSSEEVSEAPTPLRDAAPKKPAGGCCSKNARFQASLQAYMTGPKAAQVPLIQDGAPNMDGWPTCSGGCQSNAACSS
ncbi:hypothetical protein DIPPA_13568, partial [Diplonema papillatum]